MTQRSTSVLLRRGEIADLCGVHRSLVRYWQDKGKLPAIRDAVTGVTYSPKEAVLAWQREREERGPKRSYDKEAFLAFEEGKTPNDLVLEMDGMTPERAWALWEYWRRDKGALGIPKAVPSPPALRGWNKSFTNTTEREEDESTWQEDSNKRQEASADRLAAFRKRLRDLSPRRSDP